MKKLESGIMVPDHVEPQQFARGDEERFIRAKVERFDHRKLINGNRGEERRLLKLLRKLVKRQKCAVDQGVLHDDDLSCCSTESWPDTVGRMIKKYEKKTGLT